MKIFSLIPNQLAIILILIFCWGIAQFSFDRVKSSQHPRILPTNSLTLMQTLPSPSVTLPTKISTNTPIYAKSYIVVRSDTKYPLLAKNEDMKVPIASTTKIMTAMVTLKNEPLDKVITVSRQAATIEGSEIQLLTNEKMTIRNLLYALLINSANDAAYALSEASISTEDFVKKMNTEAALIGMQNTHYKDPAGLYDGYSTPRDLAILTDYALRQPLFATIVKTAKYTVWSADQRYKHELTNSNRLVDPEETLYYPNAIGVKTGFTFEAGHCLVSAAEYDGVRYISVVLHTIEDTKEASARESRKLLELAKGK